MKASRLAGWRAGSLAGRVTTRGTNARPKLVSAMSGVSAVGEAIDSNKSVSLSIHNFCSAPSNASSSSSS